MAKLKDYVRIEDGLSALIQGSWGRRLAKVMPKINKAVERHDLGEADNLLSSIDVQSIAHEAEAAIRSTAALALTFGAMMARGGEDVIYRRQALPPVSDATVQYIQLSLMAMQQTVRASLIDLMADPDAFPARKNEDGVCLHTTTHPVVLLLKAKSTPLSARLNAVVDGQSKALIDTAANIATSRLVSLGFFDQAQADGVTEYERTAALDGRSCPVCRYLHGKRFKVGPAKARVLDLILTPDPAIQKVKAPFPSQTKAAVASLRQMDAGAIQDAGFEYVPSHPGCRCREVPIGTVPLNQVIPHGLPGDTVLPDVPMPEPEVVAALGKKTLSPLMQGAKGQLEKKLSQKQLEALDQIFDSPTVSQWQRICTNPLVQKAEASFSFCSAFNPKKMGQLVKEGDKGVKAWELDDELQAWRMATGEFAKELIADFDKLTGSVIHDKGFAIWSTKAIPEGAEAVRVQVIAPKGTKAVKIGDEYAFPSGTKFQVVKTSISPKGLRSVYVKVIEDAAETANMDAQVPWWWTKHIDVEDATYFQLKKDGWSDKKIWDDNEDWLADQDPSYIKKSFPGNTPPIIDAVKAPPIVPAGTAAKEKLAGQMGSDFLDYGDLTRVGAKPGGSVPGETMTDASGQKWIVKHVANTEIARNEVLAGKLYEALGIEVPELRLVNGPNGETWVASKWLDDFSTDPSLMRGTHRIPGLYDNFVADAWLSNWDVVGMGYDNIGLRAGRAFRIDVGGALRFRAQGGLKTDAMFPDKTIDIIKMRDPAINPNVAEVFKDLTKVELNQGAAKVLALPETKIRDLIRQYGPLDPIENKKLADRMIARQKDIAERFPEALAKPAKTNPEVAAPGVTARVTADEVKAILDARLNGYAMRTDFDQIEGQNVLLAHELTDDGKDVIEATLKLRGDGLKALIAKKQAQAGESAGAQLVANAQADLDSKIITLLKGFAKQIDLGEAIRDTDLTRWDNVRTAFNEMRGALGKASYGLDPARQAQLTDVFRHYADTVSKIEAAIEASTGNVNRLAQWSDGKLMFASYGGKWRSALVEIGEAKGLQFVKVDNEGWRQKVTTRGIAKDTGQTVGQSFPKWRYRSDDLEIEFYDDTTEQRALRGLTRIRVIGDPKNAAEKVFGVLDELGVASHRAARIEQEYLYLTEMAYLKPQAWRNIAPALASDLSVQDKVEALRSLVKKEFGVSDADINLELTGRRQAFDQAQTVNHRADLKGPEWDAFAKDHRLIHDNTGSGSLTELIDLLLDTGGRVAPTVDKIRRGIKLSGMSPGADLNSGGADYFFTRVWKASKATGSSNRLVFKADPLRRTTTISYAHDLYGRTESAEFIHSHRQVSLEQLRELPHAGGNETIIKNGLSLFDDLDVIVVGHASEKQQLLDVFAKHNLREWPDGRKLDDVIRVRGEPLVKEPAAPKLAAKVKPSAEPVVPAWAANAPDTYNIMEFHGFSDDTIKQVLKEKGLLVEPKPAPVPATPSGGPPAWLNPKSASAQAYYKKQVALGYSDAQIKATIESKGWDSWLVKDAPVQSTAPAVSAPGQVPAWAYGYEEKYLAWIGKGMPPATVEKKLKEFIASPNIIPAWLKNSNDKAYAKAFYKDLKKSGVSELDAHQQLYDLKIVGTPPPVPAMTVPDWAFGYEDYYQTLLDKGFDTSKIKDGIDAVADNVIVQPSWLSEYGKTSYAGLKKTGFSDMEIYAIEGMKK